MDPTLRDVAREAGVSYQTVWRAINGKTEISSATLVEVMEVARRLGYRGNAVARGLRTQRTKTIGLVVLDVGNSYTGRLTRAIQVHASELGQSLVLVNSGDDVDQEKGAVRALLERRVDGLILNAAHAAKAGYLDDILPDGFPVVAVNRAVPGLQIPTVASRNSDAAAAADLLVARGHDQLGSLSGELTNPPFLHRSQSFRERVAQLGLPSRDDWHVSCGNHVQAARAAASDLLRNPAGRPTGIFAAGNRLTEGLIHALADLGLRRGQDVDVVGFDADYAELLDPPMPVMRQAADQMGQRAVDILINLIEGSLLPKRLLTQIPIALTVPADGGGHGPAGDTSPAED